MSNEQGDNNEVHLRGPDIECLIRRVVRATVERLDLGASTNPFISSRECARLIGVTPEHLCAMRARSEGPPWSGQGKWIRYERRLVLEWLANLARDHARQGDVALRNDKSGER